MASSVYRARGGSQLIARQINCDNHGHNGFGRLLPLLLPLLGPARLLICLTLQTFPTTVTIYACWHTTPVTSSDSVTTVITYTTTTTTITDYDYSTTSTPTSSGLLSSLTSSIPTSSSVASSAAVSSYPVSSYPVSSSSTATTCIPVSTEIITTTTTSTYTTVSDFHNFL